MAESKVRPIPVDLPTHPNPADIAAVAVDFDAVLAAMPAHVQHAIRANSVDCGASDTFAFMQVVFASGVATERLRVVEWLQTLTERALDRGEKVRALVLSQMARELLNSTKASS